MELEVRFQDRSLVVVPEPTQLALISSFLPPQFVKNEVGSKSESSLE